VLRDAVADRVPFPGQVRERRAVGLVQELLGAARASLPHGGGDAVAQGEPREPRRPEPSPCSAIAFVWPRDMSRCCSSIRSKPGQRTRQALLRLEGQRAAAGVLLREHVPAAVEGRLDVARSLHEGAERSAAWPAARSEADLPTPRVLSELSAWLCGARLGGSRDGSPLRAERRRRTQAVRLTIRNIISS